MTYRDRLKEETVTYRDRLIKEQAAKIEWLEHQLEKRKVVIDEKVREGAEKFLAEMGVLRRKLRFEEAEKRKVESAICRQGYKLEEVSNRLAQVEEVFTTLRDVDVPKMQTRIKELESAVDAVHRDNDTYRREAEAYSAALGAELMLEPEPEEVFSEGRTAEALYVLSRLRHYLDQLPERARRVLIMRYGFDGRGGRDLHTIGKQLGLSKERIRQIEAKALRQLRLCVQGPLRQVFPIQ